MFEWLKNQVNKSSFYLCKGVCMFKLKTGNVIQKLNKMDRKQAYTLAAIVVVCFIALLSLASFLGGADDTSFDGMTTRGYDLAQMPFVNDEAESYLLASKYPDMQNNGSSLLYSPEEKEARQEEDAANAQEDEESTSGSSGRENSYSGGGYGGRGYGSGRGGSRGSTTVGQLGQASVKGAGGSGMTGTFGAPRGDFSPYKSQDKGTEIAPQLKNTDAKKALSQFAQTSRAAAGLKDGKGGNAKKALMGGNIKGSEAFTDKGVDLSKSGGLALDTNAPVTSADLSNLEDKLDDAAKEAKEESDQIKEDMWDRLREQLFSGMINMVLNLAGQAAGNLLDKAMYGSTTKAASKEVMQQQLGATYDPENPNGNKLAQLQLCGSTNTKDCSAYQTWMGGGKTVAEAAAAHGVSNRDMRLNVKHNAGQFSYGKGTLADVYNGSTTQIGSSDTGNRNPCYGKPKGTEVNNGNGYTIC